MDQVKELRELRNVVQELIRYAELSNGVYGEYTNYLIALFDRIDMMSVDFREIYIEELHEVLRNFQENSEIVESEEEVTQVVKHKELIWK